MDIFSARLKWLREKKGFSQKEMAEKIRMTQQGYSKIELGQREPNLDTLLKIRETLNESVDFLIGYDDRDDLAHKLYLLYIRARKERIDLEEQIQNIVEFMSEKKEDLDERIKISLDYKNRLKIIMKKEEKAINIFYDYVITIPIPSTGVAISKEKWIDNYEYSVEYEKGYFKGFDEAFEQILE